MLGMHHVSDHQEISVEQASERETHRPPGVPFDLCPDDSNAAFLGLRPHTVQLDAI